MCVRNTRSPCEESRYTHTYMAHACAQHRHEGQRTTCTVTTAPSIGGSPDSIHRPVSQCIFMSSRNRSSHHAIVYITRRPITGQDEQGRYLPDSVKIFEKLTRNAPSTQVFSLPFLKPFPLRDETMNGRADFREPNAEVPRPIPHIGADYIPTEEERRVFAECNEESFWFRSVPLAATSMLITQGLISKGILSSHPKYGSIPKLIFACIMGYFAGKLSYVKTCQEKFKNLENSPLGEALRSGQARRSSPPG
ncbi:hypothetical protein STEG23_016870, partial [Scotinomys teguina]